MAAELYTRWTPSENRKPTRDAACSRGHPSIQCDSILRWTAGEIAQTHRRGQLIAIDQQVPFGAHPGVTNYPYPPVFNDRTADWSTTSPSPPNGQIVPFTPYSDRNMWQVTLRSDVDLLDHITATSLTSYVRFEQDQALDWDGISLDDDDIPQNDGSIRSFYQELRLSNGSEPVFRWIAGGNYQESRIYESDVISYTPMRVPIIPHSTTSSKITSSAILTAAIMLHSETSNTTSFPS